MINLKSWDSDRTEFDRNLAIFIGIDKYEKSPSPIGELTTAVKDAEAIASLLKKDYLYKKEHVITLYDKDATLEGIRNLLNDTLPNKLKPGEGDRLIIYFAGHGLATSSKGQEGPQGYLVPHDANPENEVLPYLVC